MRKISSKIAWAYFWKQKEVQAVQIISWISLVAMLVTSAAMISLFSIYNGIESTIKNMYNAFYSDLEITAASGKFFTLKEEQKSKIKEVLPEHSFYLESIEDLVLLHYDDQQKPVKLKGVDAAWLQSHKLQDYMFSGEADWNNSYPFPVLMGLSIANDLRLDIFTFLTEPYLFYLDPSTSISGLSALNLPEYALQMNGTFHIQEEFDQTYVLTPLEKAKEIFQLEGQLSAIEINKLQSKRQIKKAKTSIQEILGEDFIVRDRLEQNPTLYWIMQSEKWAIYAILIMVMAIASFNMIASISMLILEKKHEVFILRSMGMQDKQVFLSFFKLGLWITGIGAGLGIILGFLLCLGQMHFGWIAFPDGFIEEAFPVKFKIWDFVIVFFSCFIIGAFAAIVPSLTILKEEKAMSQIEKRD
ncbi:MAG TPA: FtsX-like permease family protein [Chitinophagaceae bacterium]|nr:FtsX-like permease family protein [Chitinophagaceae bacterium]